jgi:hypothetical protein
VGRCCVGARQHHRHVRLALRPHRLNRLIQRHVQHVLVQEHQRVHRLVLRRWGHPSVHRQIGQKRLDLGLPAVQVFAPLHPMEMDIAFDPVHVGPFGVQGVVVQPHHLPHPVQKLRRFGLTVHSIPRTVHSMINLILPPVKKGLKPRQYHVIRSK